MVAHQGLDLVHHLLGAADAVIAPELPLGAEGTGVGAAAGHVGDGHPLAQGDVVVLGPVEDAPVRGNGVQVLDGGGRRGGDDLALVDVGDALDLPPVRGPAALVDGARQLDHDLLTLAADDGVDPGGLAEDLLVHEGGMDAAEEGDDVLVNLLDDLQHPLGLVDRGGDAGAAHDVRLGLTDELPQLLLGDVVRHGVDELDVREASGLQRTREIGDPGRWPGPGDLGAAGAIVGVDEENAHGV